MIKNVRISIHSSRIGEQDETKRFCYEVQFMEVQMHNLVSQNQLGSWNRFDSSMQTLSEHDADINLIDDYFECLIECEDLPNSCKSICKNVFD